jgi:hypothetical protein
MTTIITTRPCSLVHRLAADAARGVITSPAARAFVTSTCPCGACAHARTLAPPPTTERISNDERHVDYDARDPWGLH